MIEITNFRQGALLNHNHGVESEKSLKVTIRGISDGGYPVKVNGVPAEMDGRFFAAETELTQKINTVTASTTTPYGVFRQELTLVWDKASFKRANVYIDDHSFLFTDLAKQRPARAFDHFYLAGLKKIHDETGFRVTLNCFYRNDHDPEHFTLDRMPDTWKSEFIDNSDWLRFSFHSYSEFPDRPYLESSAEEFNRDFDLVENEIVRFAGRESFIAPVVIHWANIHPVVAREMIRRGTRCCSCVLRAKVMGGPSLAERQKGGDMQRVQARAVSGEDRSTCNEGLELHYGFQEETSFFKKNGVYYDSLLGVFFCSVSASCCNLVPLDVMPQRVEADARAAEAVGREVFGFGSHEQYTFPYYPNYIPDHMERIGFMARSFAERGRKFVFFNEGLLGNVAWGN